MYRYCFDLVFFFFFSSRRRHTRFDCDWSSDVCSSDLVKIEEYRAVMTQLDVLRRREADLSLRYTDANPQLQNTRQQVAEDIKKKTEDRKSTRLNSSHSQISYAVFCLKKKKK